MDAAPGPGPDRWQIQRQRIADEQMWPAGVVLERDVALGRYVVRQEGAPLDRTYVVLETALSKTERRCLISAWLKEGPRLIGYRAHTWRSPRR